MKISIICLCIMFYFIIIFSNGQDCCNKYLVRVQGLGENRIKPTVATIYASLSKNGQSAQKALDQIDQLIEKIIYKLEGDGVNATEIQTSSVKVYPRYTPDNNTNLVTGYIVYMSLTITIRRIDNSTQKIGKVIDSLASLGVQQISGLSYDTQDPNLGRKTATTDAYKDANNKAYLLAQLAGKTLGNVTLVEQLSYTYNPYFYSSSQADLLTGWTSTDFQNQQPQTQQGQTSYDIRNYVPQIPVGTILISATVIVTWQMVQPY